MEDKVKELFKVAAQIREEGVGINRVKETILLAKEAKLASIALLAKKARNELEIR